MKLLLTVLLIATCYNLATAQIATDNGGNIIVSPPISLSPAPNKINLAFVNNNLFILSLINWGSHYVIGHAADSMLINNHQGNYSTIYHVSQTSDTTLNLTADVRLDIYDGSRLHAIFTINFDSSINLREVLSFSFEWQTIKDNVPCGVNISYDAVQEQYQVLPFSGFEESISYQTQDNSATTTTYSKDDFLHNYAQFVSVGVPRIYDDQTTQNAFNAALRGLRTSATWAGFLDTYDQLNVTDVFSIDTYSNTQNGDSYRFDFEFNTDTQKGRAVAVVICPIYTYYPPYPVYEASTLPLAVASDGVITSTATTEAAPAPVPDAQPETGDMPVAEAVNSDPIPVDQVVSSDPIPVSTSSTVASDVATAVGTVEANTAEVSADEIAETAETTVGDSASSGQMIAVDPPMPYPYLSNCMNGYLDYYYFEYVQDASA